MNATRRWRETLADALVRPGRIARVPTAPECPDGLPPAAAALLLALCDRDTPVWLPPSLCESRWSATWLRHVVGARRVTRTDAASVVLVTRRDRMPELESLLRRVHAPDDSPLTLLIEIERFVSDAPWRLRGPGLSVETSLPVAGEPEGLLHVRERLRRHLSRGVDTILVAGDAFSCLPRTTRVLEHALA